MRRDILGISEIAGQIVRAIGLWKLPRPLGINVRGVGIVWSFVLQFVIRARELWTGRLRRRDYLRLFVRHGHVFTFEIFALASFAATLWRIFVGNALDEAGEHMSDYTSRRGSSRRETDLDLALAAESTSNWGASASEGGRMRGGLVVHDRCWVLVLGGWDTTKSS